MPCTDEVSYADVYLVACSTCDWKALMADEHRVSNLYTPESCYRKSSSTYNRAAKYKSVIAIREGLKFLGGAQDDKEEREHLQRAIAEVGGVSALPIACAEKVLC